MMDGSEKQMWEQTSHLMAHFHEVMRPIRQFFVKDKVPHRTAAFFNPYEAKKRKKVKPPTAVEQIRAMAPMFQLPPRKEKNRGSSDDS
jgi:hypothetical protein